MQPTKKLSNYIFHCMLIVTHLQNPNMYTIVTNKLQEGRSFAVVCKTWNMKWNGMEFGMEWSVEAFLRPSNFDNLDLEEPLMLSSTITIWSHYLLD